MREMSGGKPIRKRRQRWAPEFNTQPGWKRLPTADRLRTLAELELKKSDIQYQINKLPVGGRTTKSHRLEKQLYEQMDALAE